MTFLKIDHSSRDITPYVHDVQYDAKEYQRYVEEAAKSVNKLSK